MVLDPAAERDAALWRIAACRERGEQAYDLLYEAHSHPECDLAYGDAKEAFREAIAVAWKAGLDAEAEELMERLLHIKAVYRSQFLR